MAASRKGGGPKAKRSETVTVRLDPQLRYLAEIAARIQRRTLSSYIEWAITKSLDMNILSDAPGDDRTVADMATKLWDVDEADRFVKLAINAPHLLNYDEQKLWKLIKENGAVWKGTYQNEHHLGEWHWYVLESEVNYEKLREYWPVFMAVAAGDSTPDELPGWEKGEPIPF